MHRVTVTGTKCTESKGIALTVSKRMCPPLVVKIDSSNVQFLTVHS